MRLAVLLCVACAGCDALFQFGQVHAASDAVPGADARGGDSGSGDDTPNLAFVTSMQVAPVSLGGVAGADALCASLAGAVGHPGRYVAWLASSTSGPTSRIGTSARGWVRIDGKPFADTLVDIVQGRIWYPLRITEAGDDVTNSGSPGDLVVVTGTNADGSPSANTCDDYTNPTFGATAGLADDAPYNWSTNMGAVCSAPARLYCFGIDHSSPVTLVPESTRLAFVTGLDVAADGTTTTFDDECQNEANAAQLPGTYGAAVATTAQSVLERFGAGAPWVRIDGVTAIDTSGALLAPIELDTTGHVEFPTIVWSGAPTPSARAPSAADSCFDWTRADTTKGLTGNDTRSNSEGFGGLPNTCNNVARVYCLQR